MTLVSVLLVLGGYIVGTFPSAILVARANGVDIERFGSGNPGASNVTRALGWRRVACPFPSAAGPTKPARAARMAHSSAREALCLVLWARACPIQTFQQLA